MDKQIIRLSSLSHGGGCGCKIAPALLNEMLSKLPSQFAAPALLVGMETGDDAAVYKINDRQALVATTDFFMPIVDDAFDFGRIAATNALSDVYAIGGQPLFALAIVGVPVDKLPVETVQDILAGGAAACEAAGIPIAGGHSIDAPEPIYGLVAVGLVDPDNVKRNNEVYLGRETMNLDVPIMPSAVVQLGQPGKAVTTTDIPAANGVLHLVDEPLG